MDRRGGEAQQVTDSKKGDLIDYAWSLDVKKILLPIRNAADASISKTPKTIVIDRFPFKRDV